MEFRIGTSGWNYKWWRESFYGGAPSSEWLGIYGKMFDTVEVNNTFYRWPKKEYIEKWSRETPKNFQITLKMPRSISQRKEPDLSQIQRFYELTDSIGEKMGCFLFQFPPRFKNTNSGFRSLKLFLEAIDSSKENAFEFRDKSWWAQETYNALSDFNASFVSVSGLGMPSDILSTSGVAYIRCHGGHYNTSYSNAELNEIANKAANLSAKKIYVYFNNDMNAYAPANAKTLREIIRMM